MSVPVSPHGRGSNQELGTRAALCVAKKLMTSPFPSLLDDQLDVSQRGKWLVRVLMIVTDLLQKSAEDGMFGHTTRDALDSAAIIQRFLTDNTNCHVATWYGPLTKIVSHMEVAVKFACICHGHVDERSANSGQGAKRTIGGGILPCKVWLRNFKSICEKKKVRNRAVFPASPSVKVWFVTLNLIS